MDVDNPNTNQESRKPRHFLNSVLGRIPAFLLAQKIRHEGYYLLGLLEKSSINEVVMVKIGFDRMISVRSRARGGKVWWCGSTHN
jgi:hypothetical protein